MSGDRPKNFQHIDVDKDNPDFQKVKDGYYKATYMDPRPGQHRPDDETDPDTGLNYQETLDRRAADKMARSKDFLQSTETDKEKYFRTVTGMTIEEARPKLPELISQKDQYIKEIEQLEIQRDELIAQKPKMNFEDLFQNEEWIEATSEISKLKVRINELQTKVDWIKTVIEEIERF